METKGIWQIWEEGNQQIANKYILEIVSGKAMSQQGVKVGGNFALLFMDSW